MDIILSNSSELPFYQQIKNQIKQAILKGTLQEGDLLPSIRNLADDLQVSVLTIRRVYNCYVVLGRHSCNRICIIYVINKNKKEERINTAYGRLASKSG